MSLETLFFIIEHAQWCWYALNCSFYSFHSTFFPSPVHFMCESLINLTDFILLLLLLLLSLLLLLRLKEAATLISQDQQNLNLVSICLSILLNIKSIHGQNQSVRNTRFSTSNQWQKWQWRKLWWWVDQVDNTGPKKLAVSELKLSLLYLWRTFQLQIYELCTPCKRLPIGNLWVSWLAKTLISTWLIHRSASVLSMWS